MTAPIQEFLLLCNKKPCAAVYLLLAVGFSMIDIKEFKAARAAKGYSQTTLARLVGHKQQLIHQIEKGEVRTTKAIFRIAEVLERPAHILDPDIPVNETQGTEVSILSWISAGEMTQPNVSDVEIGKVVVTGLDPRGDWIALRVQGDSMDRISPPDSIIIVNRRDKKLIHNGCYVIDDGHGATTYKRYRLSPVRFEPVSTNPVHKPIVTDREPTVVGRVRKTTLDM